MWVCVCVYLCTCVHVCAQKKIVFMCTCVPVCVCSKKGSIDLDGAKIRRTRGAKHRNHFEITTKVGDSIGRVFELYADSEKELRLVALTNWLVC